MVLSPRTLERSPTNVTSATLQSRKNETTAEEPRKILPVPEPWITFPNDGTMLAQGYEEPMSFLSLLDGHVVSQTQLERTPMIAKHC